jgi:hypothetical protein
MTPNDTANDAYPVAVATLNGAEHARTRLPAPIPRPEGALGSQENRGGARHRPGDHGTSVMPAEATLGPSKRALNDETGRPGSAVLMQRA